MIHQNLLQSVLFAVTLLVCCNWLLAASNFDNTDDDECELETEAVPLIGDGNPRQELLPRSKSGKAENRIAGFSRSIVKIPRNLVAATLDVPLAVTGGVVSAVSNRKLEPLVTMIPIGVGLAALHVVGTFGAGGNAVYRLFRPRPEDPAPKPLRQALPSQIAYPLHTFTFAAHYPLGDVAGTNLWHMYKDPNVLF